MYKCPYCGAMQYEASEKKYMNDLYKINSDMDNLDKNVRRYALLSIAKSIGYVLIGTAAALVIGVAIGRFDYKQYNDSRKERNEIHKAMDWYDDNSAKLDELYTLQRYSEARDIIRNYDGNTSLMASWEHYNFIQLYDWYYDDYDEYTYSYDSRSYDTDIENGLYYGIGGGVQINGLTLDLMYQANYAKAKIDNGNGTRQEHDLNLYRLTFGFGYAFDFSY